MVGSSSNCYDFRMGCRILKHLALIVSFANKVISLYHYSSNRDFFQVERPVRFSQSKLHPLIV